MVNTLRRLALTAGAAAAAFALTVLPASANASTTWTVGPNAYSPFTATSVSSVELTFPPPNTPSSSFAVHCTSSSLGGLLSSATGNPAEVGQVTAMAFGINACTYPPVIGLVGVVATGPMHFIAEDYASGVTSGHIDAISIQITWGACQFTEVGQASATYRNSTARLSVRSTAGQLAVVNPTPGCAPLVTTDRVPTIRAEYTVVASGTTLFPTLVGSNP
ncbi:hypothetical protein ABT025_30520 [Streptomyces sp. NPDC002809]|uniref:hypothetical protein n=1 Tax=Streptomyces sp. NPDC002809 TaxID=3154433 RepID=UPI00331A34FF